MNSKLPLVDEAKSTELAIVGAGERGAPLVTRLMFVPVKLVSKRLASRLSAQLFAGIWRVVDGTQPPPRPERHQRSVSRLALALALEGACTAVVSGLVDHASRREFARVTGRWPTKRPKLDG